MKKIPLTQGKFAVVDDEDYGWLSKWKWFAHKAYDHWYAERAVPRTQGQQKVKMHHAIIGKPPKGLVTDHINHDGLDNRRQNLRWCTVAENAHNYSRKSDAKYMGIYPCTTSKKWAARIRIGGKQVYLGCYETEHEAAEAYKQASLKYYGILPILVKESKDADNRKKD